MVRSPDRTGVSAHGSDRPPLRGLSFFLTRRCNLQCRHCWVQPSSHGVPEADMDLARVQGILHECVDLGLRDILLTGGEPLLYPDLYCLLQTATDLQLTISIETNATLVTPALARALRGHMALVSLDGSTPETHDSIRGRAGAFRDAMAGIQMLRSEAVPVHLNAVVQRANLKDVPGLITLAEQVEAIGLKLTPALRIGHAATRGEGSFLSVAEALALVRRVHTGRKSDEGMRARVAVPPAFLPARELTTRLARCFPFDRLGVALPGSVSLCHIAAALTDARFGSYPAASMAEIWGGSETLRQFRVDVPARLTGVCARCILRSSCLGYCRALAYLECGTFRAPNPFCQEALECGLFPPTRLLGEEQYRGTDTSGGASPELQKREDSCCQWQVGPH